MAVALATAIGVAAPAAAETAPSSVDDPGSLGVRLLDVPAAAVDDPRARSYIVDQLDPGTTIQRRVQVSNTTASGMDVDVYAAGASIADGVFAVADGRTANELSSWTTPSEGSVQVPAGATVDVTWTVAVPADAPPGEQYAVIWAETAGPTDGDILAISRVGIRMYVAILGDNPPASAFTVSSMTAERAEDGHGVVRIEVENTGGRALDLSGELAMSAVEGAVNAGPYPAVLGTTLAPGQSDTVAFEVTDDVADGPWDAVVDLRSGLTESSYEAQIEFPAQAGVAPAAPVQAQSDGTPGWVFVIAGLIAALAIIGIFLALRGRKRPAVARDPGSDSVGE